MTLSLFILETPLSGKSLKGKDTDKMLQTRHCVLVKKTTFEQV